MPSTIPPPHPQAFEAAHGKHVMVGETEIYYEEFGRGRPLVLIHGLNANHRTWQPVVKDLAARYRVLVPDLPGCGHSGRPDAHYSLAWQAQVMGQWMEKLDLTEVDLVGHSYGGGVALFMLLEHRARIRRLALVAPGGLGRGVTMQLRLASVFNLIERLGEPALALAAPYILRAVGDIVSEEDERWLRHFYGRPGTARAFVRTLRDVVDWRGQRRLLLDHIHRLESLPPMALFWGKRDRVIPWKHALAATRVLEGVTLTTFETCGHFPHRECPKEFVRGLCAFLDARLVPTPRCLKLSRAAKAVAAASGNKPTSPAIWDWLPDKVAS